MRAPTTTAAGPVARGCKVARSRPRTSPHSHNRWRDCRGPSSWDHDSNRLTYGTSTYTYNPDDSLNTINGGTSLTYLAWGGLIADGNNHNCYDGFDRLAHSSSTANCTDPTATSFTYDGFGRQRSHTEAATGTTSLHDDGLTGTVTVEVAPTTNVATDYELSAGGNRKVLNKAALIGNPTTQYLTDDANNNIATAVDTTGVVQCSARFDPFGNPEHPLNGLTNPCNTGSTPNTYLYRGARLQASTGTYQFGIRTYDPTKNSFLTPDSSGPGSTGPNPSIGVDPLTRNTYSYVNGDPVNLTDPTGHGTACDDSAQTWKACQQGARSYCSEGICTNNSGRTSYHADIVIDPYGDYVNPNTGEATFARAKDSNGRAWDKDAQIKALHGWRPPNWDAMTAEQQDEWLQNIALYKPMNAPCSIWCALAITAMGGYEPGAAEAGDGLTVAGEQATIHGAERLTQAGFTEELIAETRAAYTTTQADGASVFVREVSPGRFDFFVESENGVVTAHRGWSLKSVSRLAANYGWEGWPP